MVFSPSIRAPLRIRKLFILILLNLPLGWNRSKHALRVFLKDFSLPRDIFHCIFGIRAPLRTTAFSVVSRNTTLFLAFAVERVLIDFTTKGKIVKNGLKFKIRKTNRLSNLNPNHVLPKAETSAKVTFQQFTLRPWS